MDTFLIYICMFYISCFPFVSFCIDVVIVCQDMFPPSPTPHITNVQGDLAGNLVDLESELITIQEVIMENV